MKAGRMRSIIEVFSPLRVEDSYGSTKETWESHGRWHAERVSQSSRQVREASELFADRSVRYNVNLKHKVSAGWQLVDEEGVRYVITGTEPTRWLGMQTIICERLNQ